LVAPAPARKPARPKRRRRAARAPDFQRARVYRWEAEHVFPHSREQLSLEACRALVDAAYRSLEPVLADEPGWSPPLVTDGRGRRHACGSRSVIKLPRWARHPAVVLHECAHGVAPDKHGPLFVRVYIDLLEGFMALDRADLERSLAAARIMVAPAASPPRATRPRRSAAARPPAPSSRMAEHR
jgi:hypothetical protein